MQLDMMLFVLYIFAFYKFDELEFNSIYFVVRIGQNVEGIYVIRTYNLFHLINENFE